MSEWALGAPKKLVKLRASKHESLLVVGSDVDRGGGDIYTFVVTFCGIVRCM